MKMKSRRKKVARGVRGSEEGEGRGKDLASGEDVAGPESDHFVAERNHAATLELHNNTE